MCSSHQRRNGSKGEGEEVEAKGKESEGNTRCAQVTRDEMEVKGKEGEENMGSHWRRSGSKGEGG